MRDVPLAASQVVSLYSEARDVLRDGALALRSWVSKLLHRPVERPTESCLRVGGCGAVAQGGYCWNVLLSYYHHLLQNWRDADLHQACPSGERNENCYMSSFL